MTYMFNLEDIANPLQTILPIILMTASGYALGKITFYIIKMQTTFLREFIYGNIILNFIFVSGFVIFGVITNLSNLYFTSFTVFLIILFLVTCFIILKKVLRIRTKELNKYFLKSSWVNMLNDSHSVLMLLGVFMFMLLIAYHSIIINFHSIFGGELDSIYLFLPISKSILLGNGLNHDYYLGSDANIKHAPFSQVLNSWLLQSFSYSSVKIFPIYFLFFGSLLIYYIAKSITRNKILGLVSVSIYLITPALMISSSTYSLSQDFTFMFFLAAMFYLLVEVVRYTSIERINLLLLSISIAILPLIKDIGLLISIFIIFLL
ncbi:MAG TPA: phospholipid carrier-dependent glycosyltransferase, partial [Nitrososphaeraceae archaeon]|nr:phospholipid carrier-dependent glycosyltransferase [Nitrososphaeraceae archaeon]